MSSPVLVTGAKGFIGRALTQRLAASGSKVVELARADGDIARRETFGPLHEVGIGSVVHCAARLFVPESWADPAGFLETNLFGTARVLEFCRTVRARLIFVSAYVYGVSGVLPIAETAPVRANNPYAQSKYLAEQLCEFYAANYGVPVTVLRPFNAYGPGQDGRFLIPTILSQIRLGKAIEVQDLDPRRDLVFLSDLVEAIVAAERRREAGCAVFNIGSGLSHSVAEIIAAAQDVAGTGLPVRSRAARRTNEIPDVVADIAKARRELGWNPTYSLTAGIAACWRATTELP